MITKEACVRFNIVLGLEPLEGGVTRDIKSAAQVTVLIAVHLGDQDTSLVLVGSTDQIIFLYQASS